MAEHFAPPLDSNPACDRINHMKKKACISITALLTASLLMGGCVFDDQIPDLSDEEMKMVEEYAAHLLLKYDENYKAATISAEEYQAERDRMMRLAQVQAEIERMKEAEAANEKEEKKEDETSSSDGESGSGKKSSGPVFTDIDDFFGIEGLDIDYLGFVRTKTYPEQGAANDWQGVVTATTGNSLIVFKYSVNNSSSEDIYLDMVSRAPRFTFRINDSFSKASMFTVLLNDLAGYKDVIPAGESKEAVLIVEVTEAQAQNVEKLTMIMRYGEERGEYSLLY